MNRKKIILGVILTILGVIGVTSILTMEIPLPPEAEAILKENFTAYQIKLLLLVNPILMLLVAVVVGTVLYDTIGLQVPIIEAAVGLRSKVDLLDLFIYGSIGGVVAGILISVVGFIFHPLLPTEFLELSASLKPTLAARFLYGGLTEEILMRFGLMTLIVWGVSKIFNGTKPIVYWIGIITAAIIFALGHFPIVFQTVESPSPALWAYILIGNTLGGLIFGWLYWKKGLESAFLAHIFAHVVMIIAEPLLI